jgi:hypothetical protein
MVTVAAICNKDSENRNAGLDLSAPAGMGAQELQLDEESAEVL